jgi:hypothetical protein
MHCSCGSHNEINVTARFICPRNSNKAIRLSDKKLQHTGEPQVRHHKTLCLKHFLGYILVTSQSKLLALIHQFNLYLKVTDS